MITTDLSLYSSAPKNAKAASLVPDLQVAEFKQILEATSTSLRVALSSPDILPTSSLTAHFELPTNSAPAKATLESCLQQAQAGAAALTASRAVACPSRLGLVLVQGTVEYAASRKQFPVEPERDQGLGWLIPKPTRAHPTPP